MSVVDSGVRATFTDFRENIDSGKKHEVRGEFPTLPCFLLIGGTLREQTNAVSVLFES